MAITQEQTEFKQLPVQKERDRRVSLKGILDIVQSVSAVGRLVEGSVVIKKAVGPLGTLTVLVANPALEVSALVALGTFSLVRSVYTRTNNPVRVDNTSAETPGRRRVENEYHPAFIEFIQWMAPRRRNGSNKPGINNPMQNNTAASEDLDCI